MSDILSFHFSEIIGCGIIVIAILFFLVSVLVSVINTVRVLKQQANNNNMPKETMNVRVVGKRLERHRSISRSYGFRTHTTYYVTFLTENSTRMELVVLGEEYEWLQEGDSGILSCQGTRYLGFSKKNRQGS